MRISDWSSDVCSSDLLAEESIHRYIERTEYDPPAKVLEQTKAYYGDNPIGEFLTEDFIGGILNVTMYDPSNADVVIESVRSEERRVGNECVSTRRSRWSRSH